MDLSLVGLAALALVDSTSFGTLLVPVWLLLAPGRVRAGRLLVFLGTVAVAYLLLGIALVAGAGAVLGRAADLGDQAPVAGAQAVLGGALLVGSFLVPGGKGADGERRAPGRVLRWRDRAAGADGGGLGALVGVALGAVVLEVATMLPYLAATGIIASADLGPVARVGVLTGYCLVMVLPALVLLTVRVVADARVRPALERLGRWLERTGAETTAWVIGVVGFLLVRDALGRLPALTAFLDGLAGT